MWVQKMHAAQASAVMKNTKKYSKSVVEMANYANNFDVRGDEENKNS